jgi:YbbR domain-containing protein
MDKTFKVIVSDSADIISGNQIVIELKTIKGRETKAKEYVKKHNLLDAKRLYISFNFKEHINDTAKFITI